MPRTSAPGQTHKTHKKGLAALGNTRPKSKTPPVEKLATVFDNLNIIPQWEGIEGLWESDFNALVTKRDALKQEIDQKKKQRVALDEDIMALLMANGVEKVLWENKPVQIVNSNSGAKISGERLLMAGVAAQTIADCTVLGKPYQYLLIGKSKDE